MMQNAKALKIEPGKNYFGFYRFPVSVQNQSFAVHQNFFNSFIKALGRVIADPAYRFSKVTFNSSEVIQDAAALR